MSEKIDYSKYECPYSHLEKECGHKLHNPEGCQVWCQCGELIDRLNVTFEEYHEGCGGRCI